MQWKKSIIIILALCLFASHAGLAGEQIVLSPQAGHSNQEQINEAVVVFEGDGMDELIHIGYLRPFINRV